MEAQRPQTELELVRAVIGLFSDRSKWTQGYYAKTETGRPIDEHHPQATCFCTIGACLKVLGPRQEYCDPPFMSPLLRRIAKNTSGSAAAFNDESTYEQVMARLREVEAELVREKELQ